jgi:hypothetical protein
MSKRKIKFEIALGVLKMCYVNALFKGVNRQFNKEYFPEDRVTQFGDTDSFRGQITTTAQDDQCKRIDIDNAYSIMTVSDKVRKECTEVWKTLKSKAKITFAATFLGSLAGALAAIALGVGAWFLIPPLILAAVAIGLISFGIFAFSFLPFYRLSQADEQLKLWEDPIKNLIERCRQHYMQRISRMQQRNLSEQQERSNTQAASQEPQPTEKVNIFSGDIRNCGG